MTNHLSLEIFFNITVSSVFLAMLKMAFSKGDEETALIEFDMELFENLLKSYPNRLSVCGAAHGGHTDYCHTRLYLNLI